MKILFPLSSSTRYSIDSHTYPRLNECDMAPKERWNDADVKKLPIIQSHELFMRFVKVDVDVEPFFPLSRFDFTPFAMYWA